MGEGEEQEGWYNADTTAKQVRDCSYTLAHEFYAKPMYCQVMYAILLHQGSVILKHWDCTRQQCDQHGQDPDQLKLCPATAVATRARFMLNQAFREDKLKYPEEYDEPTYTLQLTEDCLANCSLTELQDKYQPIWKKIQYQMYGNPNRRREAARKKFPVATEQMTRNVSFKIPRPSKLAY